MSSDITYQIERLLNFCLKKELIDVYDLTTCRNRLLDILSLPEPYSFGPEEKITESMDSAADIMEAILDYLAVQGIIEDGVIHRDLMDARIMGELMPRASETISNFYAYYEHSPGKATDYFYQLSQDSNYIQTERIKKNLYWQTDTEYGPLEITINLSKPEKDPKEIALAKKLPQSGYPGCLLCKENAGFSGNVRHPARQNLRLIPVLLGNEEWFLQYSPYSYYNEHCIVLSPEHTPMKLTGKTFERLFEFIKKFPHYFLGSNADLPIVGGSILSHDHFQGGQHIFPMEKATSEAFFSHVEYKGITVSRVKWPLSVIRITCTNQDADISRLTTLALHIYETWQHYSDTSADILAFTEHTPHNTVTPIVRVNQSGFFEIDLALRNNRTSEEHPYGIFHPHEHLHHVKKENIGLIEVMGLAVLPGRLQNELTALGRILTGQDKYEPEKISAEEHPLKLHAEWIEKLVQTHGISNIHEDADNILRDGIGDIFKQVLEDAGVFKRIDEGFEQFDRFLQHCGFEKS